jgi:hypothetical protein
MTATELLCQLQRRDVRLLPDGERLRLNGPRGAATPELVSVILERKPELMALLICPVCNAAAEWEAGEGWLHRWHGGHFDAWEGLGAKLGWPAKRAVAACLVQSECPECSQPMRREDQGEVLACARCDLRLSARWLM